MHFSHSKAKTWAILVAYSFLVLAGNFLHSLPGLQHCHHPHGSAHHCHTHEHNGDVADRDNPTHDHDGHFHAGHSHASHRHGGKSGSSSDVAQCDSASTHGNCVAGSDAAGHSLGPNEVGRKTSDHCSLCELLTNLAAGFSAPELSSISLTRLWNADAFFASSSQETEGIICNRGPPC